jgi:hypothetical protein
MKKLIALLLVASFTGAVVAQTTPQSTAPQTKSAPALSKDKKEKKHRRHHHKGPEPKK